MTAFETAFQPFLDELFELDPVFATRIGEHVHDGAWPDMTETGRRTRLAFVSRWKAAFGALDGLSADDAIDRGPAGSLAEPSLTLSHRFGGGAGARATRRRSTR